ncbi:hypothetical protein EHV15_01975 [Paenibacillus oralis]|uniref:Uncharacterized protein n=1 Tax=Paenibacillus oralis TaxID=2490856 RepID=A0A3P3TUR8_9BACL|nr:hypothetical protein [Paenibacillus oralis]RRJ61881.1 hypothetical protein EHV15_01975 [Paenibacillus oralis]
MNTATDAKRIKLLEGVPFKEAWPNFKQNLKKFFENLKNCLSPKPSSARDILPNIQKVDYGVNDLSQIAIKFRKTNKITSARRNVTVFEYVDESGNLTQKAFISNSEKHAEVVGMDFLKNNNIPNESVKRIYTE